MEIEWVNHASFIVHVGGIHLISDPWLEGRVFDESWELIAKSQFTPADFSRITHIWFSHEHPDHFHPPTLQRIPPEQRAKITVLFQRSRDRKVISFCQRLGFKSAIELGSEFYTLSPGVDLWVPPYHQGDSWFFLRTPEGTILNFNDCETSLAYLTEIKAKLETVDVLLPQFSYASWRGGPDDVQARVDAASGVLAQLIQKCSVMKPRFVIPCASYVWFCHEENRYMNDSANDIGAVSRLIETQLPCVPIVLYPGDSWKIGEAHSSNAAIAKYQTDRSEKLKSGTLTRSKIIEAEKLLSLGANFLKNLKSKNPRSALLRIPSTTIYIRDLKQCVLLSATSGFKKVDGGIEAADISVGSEALAYALKFPWGGETLMVNGRFEVPPHGDFLRFYNLFGASLENNRGHKLPGNWVRFKARLRQATRGLFEQKSPHFKSMDGQ